MSHIPSDQFDDMLRDRMEDAVYCGALSNSEYQTMDRFKMIQWIEENGDFDNNEEMGYE